MIGLLRTVALVLVLAAWGWTPVAVASTRLVRSFGPDAGLSVPRVLTLDQDPSGYLWVSTYGGVFRFDGRRFESWAPETIPGEVSAVRAAGDTVYAVGRDGAFEIVGKDVRPLDGPPGADLRDGYAVEVNAAGLWLRLSNAVWLRQPDGTWIRPTPEGFDEDGLLRVCPLDGPDGRRTVVTNVHGLVELDGSRVVHTRSIPQVRDAIADGARQLFITGPGEVLELVDGRTRSLFRLDAAAGVDLAMRGEVLWASFDVALVRLEDGEPPQILDSDDGLSMGGRC